MNAKPEDQDPSMDDILASIRRIMLDEQARLKEGAPLSAPSADEPDDAAPPPVLLLDDSMAIREPEPLPAEPDHLTIAPDGPAVVETAPIEAAAVEAAPVETAPLDMMPVAAAFLDTITVTPTADAAPVAASAAGTPPPLDAQAIEALLAPAAAAAAAASVEAMMRQLQAERAMDAGACASAAGGATLEEVVRSELRPMLKSWLDTHLADMVERLVRAELARLTLRHGS